LEVEMQKTDSLYFLNDGEAAKLIGVSRQTLANWRHLGRGPAYIKQGRMVRYCQQDLLDFMLAGRIKPEQRG
jgi:predicted site-specific integrase-resolvase